MTRTFRLRFDDPNPAGLIRLRTARLAEPDSEVKPGDRSVIHLARVVEFSDHFYGKVKLTTELFNTMIKNFQANVYGQEIYIDVSHDPGGGAAATIKKLFLDGKKFRAEVEWTQYGIDAVKTRGFRYLSIDFTENYIDPEDQKARELGPVLFGAALTTRPRVKHLDPVQLSAQVDDPDATPCGLTPQFLRILLDETLHMDKYLKWLKTQLKALSLAEDIKTQLIDAFKNAGEGIENDATLKTLAEQFEKAGKQLAETTAKGANNQPIQLSVNVSEGGLSQDDVDAAIQKHLDDQAAAQAQRQTTLAERQTQFDNLMDAAFEPEKGELRQLSEDDTKELRSARDLITSDMSTDQIKRLAQTQITIGGRMVVATQLAQRGYQAPGATGSVHIDVNDGNSITQYQQSIDANLRTSQAFANGNIALAEKPSAFVKRVLDIFDAQNAPRLLSENRVLLGAGETDMSSVDLPLGVQRTVIREALSDLRVLELVQTLTDAGAQATTQIPYETRDTSQIRNNGIVYEGQGIHRAGIRQAMELAYITPMKLSMIVSNEVMHFSRASSINWDAWGRNVEMNARVMRELIVSRICNELQRSADSFMATDVAAEAVTPDGTTRIFKTAQFPIIRPHQVHDLQGTPVGSAENALVVTDDATAIDEYDGSGDQSAGNYYQVLNYNLGYIRIVDEAGAPSAPAGAVTCTYSYSGNVVKVDTDLGSATVGVRWNDVLRAFGARKAILAQERYVTPNFALMAHTLNDQITNADSFVASLKRSGTDTTAMGDLETIKSVPAFSTNAPGIDLGEERVLIGQRGTGSYVIAKPFRTGAPFEAVDANGLPTGEKQAYGEEYSAINVPAALRGYLTSLIAYSVTGRAAV